MSFLDTDRVGRSRHGHATEFVLRQFAPTVAAVRRAYRAFLAEGVAAQPPELLDTGLVHGADRWQISPSLRRGREEWTTAERVLGTAELTEVLRAELEHGRPLRPLVTTRNPQEVVRELAEILAPHCGVSPAELPSGRGRRKVVAARASVSYLAVRHLGPSLRAVAIVFGVSPPTIPRAVRIGADVLTQLGVRLEEILPPPSLRQYKRSK